MPPAGALMPPLDARMPPRNAVVHFETEGDPPSEKSEKPHCPPARFPSEREWEG
jgi:hypothetical protein